MKKILKYSLFWCIIAAVLLVGRAYMRRMNDYIAERLESEQKLHEMLNKKQLEVLQLKEENLQYAHALQNYHPQKTSTHDNLMNNAVNSSYALRENLKLYVFNLCVGDSFGSLYLGDLEDYTIKSCNTVNGRCLTYVDDVLYFIASGEQYIKKYDLRTEKVSDYVNIHSENLVKMDDCIYFIDTTNGNYCPIRKKM